MMSIKTKVIAGVVVGAVGVACVVVGKVVEGKKKETVIDDMVDESTADVPEVNTGDETDVPVNADKEKEFTLMDQRTSLHNELCDLYTVIERARKTKSDAIFDGIDATELTKAIDDLQKNIDRLHDRIAEIDNEIENNGNMN